MVKRTKKFNFIKSTKYKYKDLYSNSNTKFKSKKRGHLKKTKKHQFAGALSRYMEKIKSYRDLRSLIPKKYFFNLPEGKKVFAFADVHGDLSLLVKLLEMSGVMKQGIKLPQPITEGSNKGLYDEVKMQRYFDNLKWTGGSNYVVQIGDQIDRSRDVISHQSFQDEGSTFEILYLLMRLNILAIEHNKKINPNLKSDQNYVFSMLGNHEIMNVQGDLRYVSLSEFKVFTKRLNNSKTGLNNRDRDRESNRHSKSKIYQYGNESTDNSVSREKAYQPGGIIAKLMAQHYNTVLQIGPFVFVHGGLTERLVSQYDLNGLNEIVRNYLFGKHVNERDLNSIINGDKSVLWNRELSQDSHKEIRRSVNSGNNLDLSIKRKLRNIFDSYYIKNRNNQYPQVLCVGHTPQYFVKEDANLLFSTPIPNNKLSRSSSRSSIKSSYGNNNNNSNNNNNDNVNSMNNTTNKLKDTVLKDKVFHIKIKRSDDKQNSVTSSSISGILYDVLRLDTGSSRAFGKIKSNQSNRRPQIAQLSIINVNDNKMIEIKLIS
jgi:hypothetical protein